MSRRVPLGRKEGFHLEFKGRDALGDPEKIAREVVAFLNAEGGEVWVGLGEEDGRAVKVEPIPDPERERRRLVDYLIETVEPSPAEEEVRIEVVGAEGEGAVLRVEARPQPERRPYAFLRKGGRHFVKRIADRIRPMTRDEVLPAKEDPGQRDPLQRALERVRKDRNELQKQRKERLWLRLEPVAEVALDLQDRRLEEYLSEPERTGNRWEGWNFARLQFRPEIHRDRLTTVPDEPLGVEIQRTGGMTFWAPLAVLIGRGEPRAIWPPILCELVVSALRVAAAVFRTALSQDTKVVIDLALAGLEGWLLRPGTPGANATRFLLVPPEKFDDAEDFLLDRPLVVSARDLFENPDAIGYRLVERVYEAFGLRREQIPRYFDPVTRRLVLPE